LYAADVDLDPTVGEQLAMEAGQLRLIKGLKLHHAVVPDVVVSVVIVPGVVSQQATKLRGGAESLQFVKQDGNLAMVGPGVIG
jgi:hypothetical protein